MRSLELRFRSRALSECAPLCTSRNTVRLALSDALGMALDFREAKRLIRDALDAFDHQYLNDLAPFRDANPTTENIARTVYHALAATLPDGVAVAKVTAWESDGCGASYTRPA